MALSTTVFKVPEWAAQGAAMEAQAAEKRKQEAERRQKLTDAMGIDKQFVENQYKLAGKYKDATQASYNAWKESAIEFETSGSQEAKAKMEAARGQFTQALGIGLSVSATATDEINKMNASKGVGYLDTPDSAKQKYSEFASGRMETKIENGIVMVKEPDGAMVPLTQSVYFQQEQNPYNSFMLDKVDPNIKFVDPVAVAQQDAKNLYTLSGVRVDGTTGTTYNANAAAEKGVAQLRMRYESDPEIKRMIATRWYAQTNKLDKNRLGFADSAEIERSMREEPAFMEAALQDFEKTYADAIKSQRPSSQVTAGAGGGAKEPTEKDLERAGVIRAATVGPQPQRKGGKVYGATFPLSNKPIRLTDAQDLYITDVTMDSKGNIVDYKLYKTAGNFDPEKFESAKKELMGNDVLISKSQMSGLKSELIKRGLYDNMRAVASEALPNSGGLASDLDL
jgi:hypothetical protein